MTEQSPPAPRPAGRALIANAVSLVGTSAVTSGLGFVFWWLAARQLSPGALGAGTAAVAVMTLLGTLGMLGFGTLLISELPRQPGRGAGLMAASLGAVALACTVLGLLVGAALPHWMPGLTWITADSASLALFVVGVVLTGVTLVFDQAIIGRLRGDLQLVRNLVAAVTKVPALLVLIPAFPTARGVYVAWLIGNLLSLIGVALREGRAPEPLLARPAWGALRALLGPALRHHALNLALQAPSLLLPVLVAGQVTPAQNAQFYLAWMIAGFLGMIPYSLSTVLPAVGGEGAGGEGSRPRVRQSLKWSLLGCGVGAVTLLLLARPLLGLFGPAYTGLAVPTLQVLALTAFPVIVKAHFIALGRLNGELLRVAVTVAMVGVLELLGLLLGARLGGVLGLSVGLLAAYLLGALWMLRPVLRGAGWGLPRVQGGEGGL